MTKARGVSQAAVGRWPRAYLAMMDVKYRNKRYRRRIVGPGTEVTIEGFPRSGTSFAIRAFTASQPAEIRVASTHITRPRSGALPHWEFRHLSCSGIHPAVLPRITPSARRVGASTCPNRDWTCRGT